MKQRRHAQETRRKMARVMDELYIALFLSGASQVDMKVKRTEEGYHLFLSSDYDPQARHRVERLCQLLCPEERNPALVEAYWELTGGDQYSSDSELSLVGHMVDEANVSMDDERVELHLLVRYH